LIIIAIKKFTLFLLQLLKKLFQCYFEISMEIFSTKCREKIFKKREYNKWNVCNICCLHVFVFFFNLFSIGRCFYYRNFWMISIIRDNNCHITTYNIRRYMYNWCWIFERKRKKEKEKRTKREICVKACSY